MKYLIITILFFYQCNLQAQRFDTVLTLQKTYKVTATDFTADQMGNLYIVSPNMQLKKLNEKGDSLAVYNLSKRYGKLTYIDATNPLKLLLFYGNYSTLITADRLLSITNIIDLRKQNIFQLKAAATSYDSQFWIYDEQAAKVKKINDKGLITQQTVDLRQVLRQLPTPEKMIDNDNLLYVYDKLQGMFVFDYYGALKTTIAIPQWTDVVAFNKIIYGLQSDTLWQYNMDTKQKTATLLGKSKKPIKMVVAAQKLYFLYKDEIRVYLNK